MADIRGQDSDILPKIHKEIDKVVSSSQFILGENVEKFEKAFARYIGTKYAVGVNSGTDALTLSLQALGIGPGSEVLVTPFTMFASVECVVRVGATPVFVDINPDTFNIDPLLIPGKITDKTKAIIPVHLFGQCADMRNIMEIARRNDLKVVEDACQAHGAENYGHKAGSMGDTGCFSFFPTKNLGAYGDGGMITTNNPDSYELLKMLRVHGAQEKYNHKYVGMNSRLDAIQAAILMVKLKYLDKWNDKRRSNALLYDELLTGIATTPHAEGYNKHVYHQYTILIENRDTVMEYLKGKGVSTAVYYPKPLHQQEWCKKSNYAKSSMLVSELYSERVLSLPIHPSVTEEQIKYICGEIKDVLCRV